MSFFAQVGSVVFIPSAGFNSVDDSEGATIALYELYGVKSQPTVTNYGLRTLNVTARLHQRFVNISQARADLLGYLRNGVVVSLTWGTGVIEGQFLIQQLQTTYEEMDNLGNLFCCVLTLQLLESPQANALANKTAAAMSSGFASNPSANYPNVAGVLVPQPYVLLDWETWTTLAGAAVVFAAMIDALAYGGKFPQLGYNLLGVLGFAASNMSEISDNWYSFYTDGDYGIDDVSGYIADAITSLSALQGYATAGDWYNFGVQNVVYQGLVRNIFF